MAAIETISAREILDSRGFPTVEATVTLAGGARGTSPSTGRSAVRAPGSCPSR